MILEENKNKDGPNSIAYYFSFSDQELDDNPFSTIEPRKKTLSLSIVLVG